MKLKHILLALLSVITSTEAYAAANDWRFMRRDPTNIVNINYDVPTPAASSFIILDITSGVASPKFIGIGSGILYSSGTISVDSVPMSSITGLVSSLDGKQDENANLDALSALSMGNNEVMHTNGSGTLVVDSKSDFRTWLAISASDISGLSTVATTGDYDDLTNKPTIPAGQVKSDWNSSSGLSEILNKPSLATVATSGDYDDLSDTPTALSEFTNDSGFITSSALSGYLTSVTAASTYVPLTRTVNGHALSSDVTVTKGDVGLANVDNTSDTNKPISSATQTALDGKEPTISAGTSGQYWRGDKSWQTLNKSAVGLGNVDNTADSSKAFSASQITSGTFNDARISQSSVTQYQSNLSIASSQISGTKTSSYISDFTSAARTSISVTGAGSYNSGTGIITVNAPPAPTCYVGTTELSGCFPIVKSATVASGNAVFHLTSDGTSGGTALYPNGPQTDSIQLRCDNEANSPCSFGTPALSNSNKTVTVAVNKSTGINVALLSLTLLGAPAAANGTVVKMTVLGN